MADEDAAPYEFYPAQYARFGTALAAEIRREAYGEDLGQQGWRTLAEQDAIVDMVGRSGARRVLDIACGSGGPSLAIVARTGCTLTGVDIEPEAIARAAGHASALRLDGRANFVIADCSDALPFSDAEFDMVICVDAVIHLGDRFGVLRDWFRLLRRGGPLLFTDAAVLTGPLFKAEIDIRASQGAFVIVPPGVNERAIAAAGFELLRSEDTTSETADIAARLHAARDKRAMSLIEEEGSAWFHKRQGFLWMTATLARDHRLSRFRYIAGKPN